MQKMCFASFTWMADLDCEVMFVYICQLKEESFIVLKSHFKVQVQPNCVTS